MKLNDSRLKIFSVLLLLVIAISACAPVLTVTPEEIMGKTSMQVIYDQTYDTVKGAWVTAGWVGGIALGIGLGLIVYKIMNGNGSSGWGCASGVVVGILVCLLTVGIFTLIGNSSAKKSATHALQVGADTGKTRKANQYVEKIHVPVTRTLLERRVCQEAGSGGGTGCRFYWSYIYKYHEECTTSTDSEGRETETCTNVPDYWYVPFFTEEWRLSANFAMLDKFLNSKVCLEYSGKDADGDGKEDCNKLDDAHTGLTKSDIKNNPVKYYYDPAFDPGGNSFWGGDDYAWQAPENWQSYVYGPVREQWGSRTEALPAAFPHLIPGEWKAMSDALNAGRPYIATFRHDYVNWVFASDAQNLMAQSSQIQKYLDLGILPRINMPYSRYGSADTFALDYDFVQFLGGVQVPNPQEWQDIAGFSAVNVGPYLEGSMLVFFAPANLIDNPDAWIAAAKAYLSDKATFGLILLPKNLVLIGCGVDTASNMVQFCRMETGMPSGNVEIKYAIDHLSPVPFTVQSVFGSPVATATLRADGFYDSTVSIPQDGFIRLLFGRTPTQLAEMAQDEDVAWRVPWFQQWNILTDGFARVSMTSLDWLKTDMKLSADDINWVLETETKGGRSAAMWTMVGLIVVGCLLAVVAFSDQF